MCEIKYFTTIIIIFKIFSSDLLKFLVSSLPLMCVINSFLSNSCVRIYGIDTMIAETDIAPPEP